MHLTRAGLGRREDNYIIILNIRRAIWYLYCTCPAQVQVPTPPPPLMGIIIINTATVAVYAIIYI